MQLVEISLKLVAKVLQSEFVVSTQMFLCVQVCFFFISLSKYLVFKAIGKKT